MKRLLIALAIASLLMVNLLMPGVAYATAPATPIQESPANGATDLPPQVTVRWTLSNPGETYRVQVARDSTFNTLVTDAQVQDATGYTLFNLSRGTTYYWRVNASANGQTSPWSPVWSFTITTREIPAVPVLVSPANGTTGVPDRTPVVWNAVPGADSYDIQVAQTPSFLGSKKTVYAFVGTSFTFVYLSEYSKTFYWRVRSRNVAGTSAWSTAWSFTCVHFGCD